MAVDDWQSLSIYGVGDSAAPLYLQVHAGDLDGDGTPDDAILKLDCANGRVAASSYQIAPRDAASGMATGRRQYAPVRIVKEWGAASPQLSAPPPAYTRIVPVGMVRLEIRSCAPVLGSLNSAVQVSVPLGEMSASVDTMRDARSEAACSSICLCDGSAKKPELSRE